jgi:hypothetical protein
MALRGPTGSVIWNRWYGQMDIKLCHCDSPSPARRERRGSVPFPSHELASRRINPVTKERSGIDFCLYRGITTQAPSSSSDYFGLKPKWNLRNGPIRTDGWYENQTEESMYSEINMISYRGK